MFGMKEEDNPFPPTVSSFIQFLREAGASEEDLLRIGFRNARELYGIP